MEGQSQELIHLQRAIAALNQHFTTGNHEITPLLELGRCFRLRLLGFPFASFIALGMVLSNLLGTPAVKTSRTLSPLHFEDLEPHRFEDLVRQLVYNFRPWHTLEATGRTGGDEGVDIRGVERVPIDASSDEVITDEGEAAIIANFDERIWIIQCKREKNVGPTKIRSVIQESLRSLDTPPYGFLLAAATDFSVKAREVFREEMRNRGIEEFALWGKAELEDRLFEARHDHLLFAYFGVSLQVRQRSVRSLAANRLATKRRLIKVLGDISEDGNMPVLLRDVDSEQYPIPSDPATFRLNPLWRYYRFTGHVKIDHLAFVFCEYWAWIKADESKWDALEQFDQGLPVYPKLILKLPDDVLEAPRVQGEHQARQFWLTQVPQAERAYFRRIGLVHYDRIATIDDIGDRFHQPPHLLLICPRPNNLFDELIDVVVKDDDATQWWQTRNMERTSLFPLSIPDN